VRDDGRLQRHHGLGRRQGVGHGGGKLQVFLVLVLVLVWCRGLVVEALWKGGG
jgi:hypothetical protein